MRNNPTAIQRTGVTLTEVLVAIFVMGIGLLSLLVLFPLGALQMARAIRDQRVTHCGANASAIANFWSIPTDPTVNAQYSTALTGTPALPAPTSGPSWPVIVDPLVRVLGLGPSSP